MNFDYNFVTALSNEEFEAKRIPLRDLEDPMKFTKSDKKDMRRIENLLDVSEGVLVGDYYFERIQCSCGNLLTMYDFVFTAIVDASHPKSFVLHTLVGNKKIINQPRITKCSACGTKSISRHRYFMSTGYGCGAE